MTELKPCPFCGGEAVFYKDLDPFVNQEYAFVKCSVCGCSTPSYAMSGASVKDVAKHWNRRPEITIQVKDLIPNIKPDEMDYLVRRIHLAKEMQNGN